MESIAEDQGSSSPELTALLRTGQRFTAPLPGCIRQHLATAAAAGRELAWNTPDTPPPAGQAPAYAPELQTREKKVIWLEDERANLHAAADYAVRKGLHVYAIGIPFAMHGFLRTNGYWNQALSLHQAALITAQHGNDQPGQASALCQLGAVQRLTGDYRGAVTSQAGALDLYRELCRPGWRNRCAH
jgi:hypothetical protein